jgi:hypothetical protein
VRTARVPASSSTNNSTSAFSPAKTARVMGTVAGDYSHSAPLRILQTRGQACSDCAVDLHRTLITFRQSFVLADDPAPMPSIASTTRSKSAFAGSIFSAISGSDFSANQQECDRRSPSKGRGWPFRELPNSRLPRSLAPKSCRHGTDGIWSGLDAATTSKTRIVKVQQ